MQFVKFYAKGTIWKRGKNGTKRKGFTEEVRHGTGICLDGPDLYGTVFRQCPNLVHCDNVTISTEPILSHSGIRAH